MKIVMRVASALLVLAAMCLCVDSASAQLFQWTPEQLIKYTSKNPYDRFPDGRPKVPDEMLERLKGLIAEEVQAALPSQDFPNQFESRDGWKVLQPDKKMVGRVLTIQFMPAARRHHRSGRSRREGERHVRAPRTRRRSTCCSRAT